MKVRQFYFGIKAHGLVMCFALFGGSILTLSSAYAAFCSLRDPLVAIHSLYPESDQHRSIVRTISREVRERIGERLPFTLHFNEIGRHMIYVAQKQTTPLGIVHARTELSDLGLIEIAWAMTVNLEIHSFYFQRCRNSACNETLRQKLLLDLHGKSLSEILLLISPDGSALASSMASRYQNNQSLVLSIVRSALKTIAATEYGWKEDISKLHRRSVAAHWLGDGQSFDVLPIVSSDLKKLELSADSAPVYAFVEPSSIQAFRIMVDDAEVARLIESDWQFKEQTGHFRWIFTSAGEVLAIENNFPMPNQETTLAFNQLIGKKVASEEECNSAAELVGHNLFINAYRRVEVADR